MAAGEVLEGQRSHPPPPSARPARPGPQGPVTSPVYLSAALPARLPAASLHPCLRRVRHWLKGSMLQDHLVTTTALRTWAKHIGRGARRVR